MILQTIKLPFDAGTADTIYTKQGETGRGIWFDFPFDIPADELENYKCEFIAVKPDDTFVIEDAGLSTHGEGEGDDIVYHTIAQLTLPEQVSAAKGTGSYIIKIYDYVHDNDLIYSAAGGLYVDDHLLLDSMIESIAEVNGYNFPDDFLTSADLAELIDDSITAEDATWSSHKIDEEITDAAAALQDDIDELIDDNATSADTTWSSSKISDELGNIDTGHHYSTTEHEVGTWIDGSTLYEKTYTVASVPGPISYVLEANISNFEIIDFSGVFLDDALRSIPAYATISTPVVLYKYNNNLYLQNSLNTTIYNVVVTIRYYKS